MDGDMMVTYKQKNRLRSSPVPKPTKSTSESPGNAGSFEKVVSLVCRLGLTTESELAELMKLFIGLGMEIPKNSILSAWAISKTE